MRSTLNKRQIWGIPLLLGLTTAVGLIAALMGDGVLDVVSWIALAIPIATILRHTLRKF